MSRRDDVVLLRDMLNTARTAVGAIQGRRQSDLSSDVVWALGLAKCLEIIGEAAARLSEPTRGRYPEIPWQPIIGMRNRLVHAYFDIDPEQVWKALTEDLPPLIEQLECVLTVETLPDSDECSSS